MSTTTTTTTAIPAPTTTTRRFPLLKSGVAAGAVAAVATTLVAVSAHVAGVSFEDRTGAAIPWPAFAQLTFIGALLGVALAAGVRRRATNPRRTFTRTSWALAVLSCVAPALIGLSATAAGVLAVDHLVAAALVIPRIAARLRR